MKLSLTPHNHNSYPIAGILIAGASPNIWLKEIQMLGLSLANTQVYPLPDTTPHSVWGCLLLATFDPQRIDIRLHTFVQSIEQILYIPEKTKVSPLLSSKDLDRLFLGKPSFWHPVIGLVELGEPLIWADILAIPTERQVACRRPASSVFIPQTILSYEVIAQPENEHAQLEEQLFPQPAPQKLEPDKLSWLEKTKLALYKSLFHKKTPQSYKPEDYQPKELLTQITSFWQAITGKAPVDTQQMQIDLAALEERNRKVMDKFLDMLKNNPQEALKYAIPLSDNTERGEESTNALLDLMPRWSLLDWLHSSGAGTQGGGGVVNNDLYQKLYQQYSATAQELIAKKQYKDAAFTYMRLLKDYHSAAQALQDGGYYEEAAMIYLKYIKDKPKAALCYEKGNMYQKAIQLYTELGNHEAVGDLYMKLNRKPEALQHYQLLANDFEKRNQYLKASLIYKNKMGKPELGQHVLLQGWKTNQDAFNCLNNYLHNIPDENVRWHSLMQVYAQDVATGQRETFLQVLAHEYKREKQYATQIREIAYEILAQELPKKPYLASELIHFNNDSQLAQDTMRYKYRRK